MNDSGVPGTILPIRSYMFDGTVVRYKVNAIVEAQPEIALVVEKNTQYIIVLQSFRLRKTLNNISFQINDVNATVVCGQCQPLLINRCR